MMMKELIEDKTITVKIGIDAGNSFTNVVSQDCYYDVFSSCVTENFGGEKEDGINTLEIDNHHYTIGQGNLTAENTNRRDLAKYEALVVFGVCRNLEQNKIDTEKVTVEIHLGIGLPLGAYSQHKETYSNLFKNKVIHCNYQGKSIKFLISEVRVVPQATVVAYLNKELFSNIQVGYLIDWGSFTVDVQTIRGGEIVKNEKKSYDLGTLKMLTELGERIKNYGGSFVDLKDIERVLMDGEFDTEENGVVKLKEKDDLYTLIKTKVNNTVSRIKMENPQIRNSRKTVVIGGGAIVFKEILEENLLNCTILDDAEKLNAKAYYEFVGGR